MITKKDCIIYRHNLKNIPIYYGRGIVKNLPLYLNKLNFDKIAVITDLNVKKHLGRELKEAISEQNYRFFTIPAGEKYKGIDTYKRIVNLLFDWKITKNSVIIAFGGGVVGNLAGFLASTIYRGIKLVHIPTTIISQADSSIGGKQAINTPYGKNTIGSIYEPEFVITDFNFLKTLPKREVKCGVAESIKHALCQDEILLKRLSRKGKSLGVISKLIEDTIKLKIRLFELDEKGVNESNIFIYGHEIGRVIESISKGKLTHGEAISIGMCCSARLSNSLGHLSDRDLIRHFTVLKKWGLPTRIPKNISVKDISQGLESGGKLVNSKIQIILLENIGLPAKTNGIIGNIVKKNDLLICLKNCY